jgi:hypothetical protein
MGVEETQMISRIFVVLAARRMRKELVCLRGVSMISWWKCIALPYLITGKVPKLGTRWYPFESSLNIKR